MPYRATLPQAKILLQGIIVFLQMQTAGLKRLLVISACTIIPWEATIKALVLLHYITIRPLFITLQSAIQHWYPVQRLLITQQLVIMLYTAAMQALIQLLVIMLYKISLHSQTTQR